MAVNVSQVRQSIRALSDSEKSQQALRFFKTGPGEYGEGDQFLGIRVPIIRQLVKRYREAPLSIAKSLLQSPFHEERLFALLLMVHTFERGGSQEREAVYALYLEKMGYINNWDLVDGSAHQIVGSYLFARDRAPLYQWVSSNSIWERRIAIMATFHFIRRNDYADALRLSEQLLTDSEDLIHKAVGWMLREVGNRDRAVEEKFLEASYQTMPRTMLRYAIEKFPEAQRQAYLKGTI